MNKSQKTDNKKIFMIAIAIIVLLACNFPSVKKEDNGESNDQPDSPPIQQTEAPLAPPPSSEEVSETSLPVLTLKSNEGVGLANLIIFSGLDDRTQQDFWWNNIGFIIDDSNQFKHVRMVSLGMGDDLSSIQQISTQGMSDQTFDGTEWRFTPEIGEVFAVEITTDQGKTYSLFRIFDITEPKPNSFHITLEILYPYSGTVTDNP